MLQTIQLAHLLYQTLILCQKLILSCQKHFDFLNNIQNTSLSTFFLFILFAIFEMNQIPYPGEILYMHLWLDSFFRHFLLFVAGAVTCNFNWSYERY